MPMKTRLIVFQKMGTYNLYISIYHSFTENKFIL